MRRSKLVIIEGIPGSGKTSTARFAARWLEERGLHPRLHLEGDVDHLADFESVACLGAAQYASLCRQFPGWKSTLDALARPRADGEIWLSFGKLDNPPAELRAALSAQDVYNQPEADFLRLSRERWAEFAAQAGQGEEVYVFECCLLQNQLTTLMAVHDTPPARIAAHLRAIAADLAPLRPLLVYLDPPDVRAVLRRAAAERPAGWLEFVVHYTAGQAWGRARGLNGLEGMLDFYAARRDLEKELFPGLFPGGLWLEHAGEDWPATTRQVERALTERLV